MDTEQKERKHNVYSSKEFLNMPFEESDASIFGQITIKEYKNSEDNKRRTYSEIELKIRDCQKVVSLCFDVDNEESYINGLYKCDVLLKEIKKFKEALKKARKITVN